MSMLMPGSFPSEEPDPPILASQIFNQEQIDTFTTKQESVIKTKYQHNILLQLDSLTYIIIGYQYIKYCHSACLLPVVLNIFMQKVLTPDVVTEVSAQYTVGLLAIISVVTRQQHDGDASQSVLRPSSEQIATGVLTRTCQLIYWKYLLTSVYHVLFVSVWMMLLANNGSLDELTNGTWWLVSFIGESVPQFDPNSGKWHKLMALGLPELLISDLVLLFLQLVQFQSIYRQSTQSPLGHRLDENELDIIRAAGDTGGSGSEQEDQNGVPLVLRVKLYESMSRSAYVRQ